MGLLRCRNVELRVLLVLQLVVGSSSLYLHRL